jgi:hypothetical protein
MNSALLVSLAALGFTLFSFWWMHWRPGRLQVGNIGHFAAGMATEGATNSPNVVLVTLPLVIFNTGARPVVIESLRLVGTSATAIGTLDYEALENSLPLPFAEIKYERDYFFLPFALRQNEVVKKNFVFAQRGSTFAWGQLLYHLHLEVKVSGISAWRKLKDIELDFRDSEATPSLILNVGYTAYPGRRAQ